MRALCLWLPDWPIQRLAAKQALLRGQPLVLHAAHARGGVRVVAASEAARRLGVQVAMPLAEATALAKRQTRGGQKSLVVQEADPLADRQALVQLAQWCQRYSPLVGLEEAAAPESLFFDVTGLAPLFGSEQALAERAAGELAARHLSVRIAIADTLGAAWAVAHYSFRATAPQIVTAGEQAAALAPLPLAALRLPKEVLEPLARLGIEQIDELLALPRGSLQSRFGAELLLRLDQALGAAGEVFTAVYPPPQFSAAWTLEYATERREMINFALEHLIARVAAQLSEAGRGATQLRCRFGGERELVATLEVGLFRPSALPRHLWELVRMQLERTILRQPIAQIEVQAVRSARLAARQQELFATEQGRTDAQQLALLVDRLAGRLGSQAVLQVHLRPEAQPERAWRAEPLIDRSADARRSSAPQWLLPLQRPLWLLPRPLPLEEVVLAETGPPRAFRVGDTRHETARYWGPERIENGWWRRRTACRDYYRLETTCGQWLWIYQHLNRHRWFCHGEFD